MKQVPWCRNSHANSLATLATMSDGALPQLIIMEELNKPRWKDWSRTMVWSVRAIPSYMDPIMAFLKGGDLLEEAVKI